MRLPEAEERVVLREMERQLEERGICLRQGDKLVFPSHCGRDRPAVVEYPSVFVSYRVKGYLDDIYATLVVKLADSELGTVTRQAVNKGLSDRDKQRLTGATESCIEILERFGVRRDSVFLGMLNAGHPGGMLPLTGRERLPLHADHLAANLYVADASLLPQSLGKPPMLTIMALAKRVAGLCLERFA